MDLLREAIRPEGSNCFSRGSIPVFLMKHIATCGFSGGGVCTPPFCNVNCHLYCFKYYVLFDCNNLVNNYNNNRQNCFTFITGQMLTSKSK